jgi:hypothetical protein
MYAPGADLMNLNFGFNLREAIKGQIIILQLWIQFHLACIDNNILSESNGQNSGTQLNV